MGDDRVSLGVPISTASRRACAIIRRRRKPPARMVNVAQLVELLVVVQAVEGSSPFVHPPGTVAPCGCGGIGRRARFRS